MPHLPWSNRNGMQPEYNDNPSHPREIEGPFNNYRQHLLNLHGRGRVFSINDNYKEMGAEEMAPCVYPCRKFHHGNSTTVNFTVEKTHRGKLHKFIFFISLNLTK